MKNKKLPKVNRTIRFPIELLDSAHTAGVDVSEFCRQSLAAHLQGVPPKLAGFTVLIYKVPDFKSKGGVESMWAEKSFKSLTHAYQFVRYLERVYKTTLSYRIETRGP